MQRKRLVGAHSRRQRGIVVHIAGKGWYGLRVRKRCRHLYDPHGWTAGRVGTRLRKILNVAQELREDRCQVGLVVHDECVHPKQTGVCCGSGAPEPVTTKEKAAAKHVRGYE